MNKNVKKIVAIALAIGTVSAVVPSTNYNLLSTKVYAAENTESKLKSLELLTESGSKIKLYDSNDYKNDDIVNSKDVEADDVYYAKTSSETVNIDIDGPSSKYVRVFKANNDNTQGKKITDDINLQKGSRTNLTIRVYDQEPGDNVRYKDDFVSEYKIKVNSVSIDEDPNIIDDTGSYDDVYLERLSVNGQSIPLSDKVTKYTYDVASDVDEVEIKVKPEYDDYDVTIGDKYVDEDDKYKTKVNLEKGENEIKIKVEDDNDGDDECRVYTLVINRGKSSTNTSTTTDTTKDAEISTKDTKTITSQWIQNNGVWQYYDENGKLAKSRWIQNYYVQADGSLATGWLNIDGNIYYLGTDGAKKTGWQSVNGVWYYLAIGEGRMITGWFMDVTGKYYYLKDDGTMAYSTKIGLYTLGADGAWIGR